MSVLIGVETLYDISTSFRGQACSLALVLAGFMLRPRRSCRFFTFWGTLLCLTIMASSLYRLIGTSVRSIVAGVSTAVVIMLMLFIGSGFVLLRKQIPDWWIWIFWMSPLQYTMTGLANNEFSGDSYQGPGDLPPEDAPDGLGKLVLDQYQFLQGAKWRCAFHLQAPRLFC
jgi:hypothetical protein